MIETLFEECTRTTKTTYFPNSEVRYVLVPNAQTLDVASEYCDHLLRPKIVSFGRRFMVDISPWKMQTNRRRREIR